MILDFAGHQLIGQLLPLYLQSVAILVFLPLRLSLQGLYQRCGLALFFALAAYTISGLPPASDLPLLIVLGVAVLKGLMAGFVAYFPIYKIMMAAHLVEQGRGIDFASFFVANQAKSNYLTPHFELLLFVYLLSADYFPNLLRYLSESQASSQLWHLNQELWQQLLFLLTDSFLIALPLLLGFFLLQLSLFFLAKFLPNASFFTEVFTLKLVILLSVLYQQAG